MTAMFLSEHLDVNPLGHLAVDGVDTLALAEEYGTPLYVMSEAAIRENCRLYQRSMERFYGGQGMVAYASKAFCCKAICRLVMEEVRGGGPGAGRGLRRGAVYRPRGGFPYGKGGLPRQQQDGGGAVPGPGVRGGENRGG